VAVNVFTAGVPIERVRAGLAAVRAEHEVVLDFSAEVLAEADRAVARYRLPETDLTDLPFLTLDPITSTDLDQAFFVERSGSGFRVRYAIADVPAFVGLGGALDAETRRRGETVYCPDLKASLHPPVLADDAASLLPGQVRGAYVWTFDVDDAGSSTLVSLRRAAIRSRAKLGYEQEQERLEEGQPHPQVVLLREVGTRRIAQEVARGAVSLPSPSQEVHAVGDDAVTLDYRVALEIEAWNAQLSLMTGMAAARIMLDGGIGVLRTMPPPAAADIARVRASARALGISWPQSMGYPDLIRSLDPGDPQQAAFLDNVTTLMRGAGYTAFEGVRPELTTHSAIAGEYAHATAPLRRLVDRFVLATCLALVEGREVEPGIRAALPELPDLMAASGRRARAVDRASMDYLEAELLAGREGVAFRGVVIEQRRDDGIVQLADPAITARVRGRDLPVGEWIDAWVAEADPSARRVVFDVTPRSKRP
jgi:exoribonuclease R